MDLTSLDLLNQETNVAMESDCLIVMVPWEWVVAGEDRLSYITVLRLVECCREYHWRTDVTPFCEEQLDSILVSCEARFRKPIRPGSQVAVRYRIVAAGTKSYDLDFCVSPRNSSSEHASVRMRCVFLDPVKGESCTPPRCVAERLTMAIARGPNHV